MTWQVGRYWARLNQSDHPEVWGDLLGFSIDGGRGSGLGLAYLGARARITFEGGTGWQDYSPRAVAEGGAPYFDTDPVQRLDGVMIRWAPDGVVWPKGPPVIFAGQIVSAETRHGPDAEGNVRAVTTALASDFLDLAVRLPLPDIDSDPNGAYQAIRAFASGELWPVVRLGDLHPAGVTLPDHTSNVWNTVDNIGDFIRLVAESTGTEAYMRHGERLDPSPPPTGIPERFWAITRPELVVREVGGSSTFDAPHIIVTFPGETQVVYEGAPIARRYEADEANEVVVATPKILDSVTLETVGGLTASASAANRPDAAVRHSLTRSGLVSSSQQVLDTVAQRYLDDNTQAQRPITVRINSMAPDRITYWAGIGIGDEIAFPPHYGLAGLRGAPADDYFVAIVREVRWDVTGDGADLELTVNYHDTASPPLEPVEPPPPPPPAPTARWVATMTVGTASGSSDTGWSVVGSGDYGTLTEHTVNTPDGDALLDSINWAPGSSTFFIWADTAADADRLDGMWLNIDQRVRGELSVAAGGRQLRLDTAPDVQPWRDGEELRIEFWDVEPPLLRPFWEGTLTVGSRSQRRGFSDSFFTFGSMEPEDIPVPSFGTATWQQFWRQGATSWTVRMITSSHAVAMDNIWLTSDVGDIHAQIERISATSLRMNPVPTLLWDHGDVVTLHAWTTEPETVTASWTTTMTVGSDGTIQGFSSGNYGSLVTDSFMVDSLSHAVSKVAFLGSATSDNLHFDVDSAELLVGHWLKLGPFVHELTEGERNGNRFTFTFDIQPDWADGDTVFVGVFGTDPTGHI